MIDTCHDLQDLQLPAVSGQHVTQRCDEPWAMSNIPPGIITWTGRKSHGFVFVQSHETRMREALHSLMYFEFVLFQVADNNHTPILHNHNLNKKNVSVWYSTWCSGERIQKICLDWNLLSSIGLHTVSLYAWVQIISSAGLDVHTHICTHTHIHTNHTHTHTVC